jgi:hypothetical protein
MIEYKVQYYAHDESKGMFYTTLQNALNELGKERWKLCSFDGSLAIFWREVIIDCYEPADSCSPIRVPQE